MSARDNLDQAGHPPSLRCPYEETLGPQLPSERTADAQAESSLGAHVILLVLSCSGLYII